MKPITSIEAHENIKPKKESHYKIIIKVLKDDYRSYVYVFAVDGDNKKYVYKIDKIYNEKKTGRVRILRNKNNTTLTLITCTKDDNYHQTVYIAYLTSVE